MPMLMHSYFPQSEPHTQLAPRTCAPQSLKVPSPRHAPPFERSLHQGAFRRRGLHNRSQSNAGHRRLGHLASILCVDDDEEVANLLASALKDLGYAVELAADGELGLERILANPPDLVLCDL